jgi:hypothetical protein
MTKDNKAYLLYDLDYDDYNFCAIFSTKKQLREYIELHKKHSPWLGYCHIAELPLNPIDFVGVARLNGLVNMTELGLSKND